jgi:hypothetical protein
MTPTLIAARLSFTSALRLVRAIARSEPGTFTLIAIGAVWGLTTPLGQGLVAFVVAGAPWLMRRDGAWQYHTRFMGCSPSRLLLVQATIPAIAAGVGIGFGRMSVAGGALATGGLLANAAMAAALPRTVVGGSAARPARRSLSPLSPFYISIVRERSLSLLFPLIGGVALSHIPTVVISAMIWVVLVLTKGMMTRPRDRLLEAAGADGRRFPIAWSVLGALAMLALLVLPVAVAGLLRSTSLLAPLLMVGWWSVSCVTLAALFVRQQPGRRSADVMHFFVVILAVVPPAAAWMGARLWRAQRLST